MRINPVQGCAGVEQAAKKRRLSVKTPEKHTSGAKQAAEKVSDEILFLHRFLV
jgi:hypothetical protein